MATGKEVGAGSGLEEGAPLGLFHPNRLKQETGGGSAGGTLRALPGVLAKHSQNSHNSTFYRY